MAAKKPTGKAVQRWDEKLAAMANVAAKLEEDSLGLGNSISTQGGQLTYRDNPVPGNKMNVVILDHAFVNRYYGPDRKFDPDNPANPICFALAKGDGNAEKVEKNMAPHDLSEEKQSGKCATCPRNQWGSADTGRGKACSNNRRLILIPEDGLEDVENAQLATIMIPTTSVKIWAGYVTNIASVKKRPPLGVVTEISLTPDKKHQFEMHFKLVREVDGENIGTLIDKAMSDATQKMLMQPYTPIDDEKPKGTKPAKSAKTRAGAKARR